VKKLIVNYLLVMMSSHGLVIQSFFPSQFVNFTPVGEVELDVFPCHPHGVLVDTKFGLRVGAVGFCVPPRKP
jgi:hypothetical protein